MKAFPRLLFVSLSALTFSTPIFAADCDVNSLLRDVAFGEDPRTPGVHATALDPMDAYQAACVSGPHQEQLFAQAIANLDGQLERLSKSGLKPSAKRFYSSLIKETRADVETCAREKTNAASATAVPRFEIVLENQGIFGALKYNDPTIDPSNTRRGRMIQRHYIANDLDLFGGLKLCEGSVRVE